MGEFFFKNRWYLLGILLVCKMNLFAQDPSYAQFYAQRIYLNPGSTGSESGLNIATVSRYQWGAIPGGFTTYGVALDVRSTRLSSGVGFMVMQNREAKIVNTTQVMGAYSYIIKLSKTVNLNVGLAGSFVNKNLDPSKLIFSDQIDPIIGVTDGTGAQLIRQKINYFDLDAGALLKFGWTYRKMKYHNVVGFATHHLTSPVVSFENIETKLPIRYTVHYGGMFPMNFSAKKKKSMFYLSPVFKFDYQAGLKELTYGFFNSYDPIYIGLFYKHNTFFTNKNTRTLIFTGGYNGYMGENLNYIVGYSYDFNMSGLGTKSRGVHEVTLRMTFPEVELLKSALKSRGSKPQKCYDFGGKNSIRLF